jgi:hypothetical protein
MGNISCLQATNLLAISHMMLYPLDVCCLLERVHEALCGLLAPPDPHLVLPGPLTGISAVGLK